MSHLVQQCVPECMTFMHCAVRHSLFCFRVQSWAQTLSSKLWELGQICGLNELDERPGQPVRYNSNSWKVMFEFVLCFFTLASQRDHALDVRN